MTLNIKYFGLIAEITNCNEEILDFFFFFCSCLLELLFQKYPTLVEIDFQIAQNQEIISKNTIITGSELALLPPFSGG